MKVSKQRFPSKGSQVEVSKHRFPSEGSQVKVPKQRLPSKVKVPVVQVLTSTQGFCGTGSQVKNPGHGPNPARVREESVESVGPFVGAWESLCGVRKGVRRGSWVRLALTGSATEIPRMSVIL